MTKTKDFHLLFCFCRRHFRLAESLWCAGMRGHSTYQAKRAMAFLRTTLCAALMVTVVMSKPICQSEDSSNSSESSESNSSEEIDAHCGPPQEPLPPAATETDMPNVMEVTDPQLPFADEGPFLTTLNTSALPDPEDPQISTDANPIELMPDDPSQTTLGTDVFQDMPVSDPSQTTLGTDVFQDMPVSDPSRDSITADSVDVPPDSEGSLHPECTGTDTTIAVGGTNQPEVTTLTASLRFPQGVTPPFPLHIITPTPPQFSAAPPLPIAMGPVLAGVPVCFTFQFVTPEPDPPRGDSM